MTIINLKQPVRLAIGGGLDKDGKKKPEKIYMLAAGMSDVSDEIAEHPYVKAHLAPTAAAPTAVNPLTTPTAKEMLERLGLSPQQRAILDQMVRVDGAKPRDDADDDDGKKGGKANADDDGKKGGKK